MACQLGMDAAHRDSEAQAETPHHCKVTGVFPGPFLPWGVPKYNDSRKTGKRIARARVALARP